MVKPEAALSEEPRHLVLVGMMGSGKSTIGRVVASRLGRPLFDTDQMVEQREGSTVRQIWLDRGESQFRSLETDVLRAALQATEPSVIAAAGGVVISEINRRLLGEADARVVWLLADVEVLLARVRNGPHRPLLDDDPEATLQKMFVEREPWYREVADVIVSVDHRSVDDVVQAVLRCCA